MKLADELDKGSRLSLESIKLLESPMDRTLVVIYEHEDGSLEILGEIDPELCTWYENRLREPELMAPVLFRQMIIKRGEIVYNGDKRFGIRALFTPYEEMRDSEFPESLFLGLIGMHKREVLELKHRISKLEDEIQEAKWEDMGDDL